MGNVDYTLRLTNSQKQFFDMVEALGINHLWDKEKREYIPEAIDEYLSTASHGEAIIARFCLGVWKHDNEFNFDFIEAASVLDQDQMKIVTGWMTEPFWP